MPSLSELIQRVHDQLDYNPDLQQYKDSVARRINDHYLSVSDNDHWLFLQKTSLMHLKKEVTGSSTSTISITTAHPRKVVGTGTAFSSAMEGQTFVDPNNAEEITIGKVVSNTEMYLTAGHVGAAITNADGWKVKFDRYALPPDCVEALGFMDRDDNRGRLRFIDRRREEIEFLDVDDTGEPFVVIEDDHLNMRQPFSALTAVASKAGIGSGLLPNNEYEYMYTFLYAGRQSPPSPVTSVETTADLTHVVLSGFEDTTYMEGTAHKESYKQKRLYRRDKTNNGRWLKVADVDAGATSYSADDELLPVYAEDFDHVTYQLERGPRQHVRLWFTADEDRTIEIRYQRRPMRLQADSDHPHWPVQYHHLLVYLVLQDVMMQHGALNQAQLWGRRAADLLKRMRNRYLSRTDRKFIRRGFDNRRPSLRFSPPVKT